MERKRESVYVRRVRKEVDILAASDGLRIRGHVSQGLRLVSDFSVQLLV